MTRFRRLTILPLGALAAVAAATVVWQLRAPAWLLPIVAAEIEAATHLRLEVDATPEARLLPSPAFRVAKVRLASAEDRGAPLLTAESLEVTFAWRRLLRLEAEIDTLHLAGAQVLAPALHPPLDIVAHARSATVVEIVVAAPAGRARIVAHPDNGTLALDDVVVQSGRFSVAGTGRLLARDPLRLVLNTQMAFGEARLGNLAVALSYSSDGVVLERAEWRRIDGGEVELFGHAAVDGAGLRFEGGLAATLGAAGSLDASARFDGRAGPNDVSISIDDLDVRADRSHLTGRATYSGSSVPSLAAELRIDRLDFAALTGVAREPAGPLTPLLLDGVATADTELRLRVGEIILNGGALADGVVVDMTRRGGTIELRELAARSFAGAPLRAAGRIALGPSATVAAEPVELSYGSVRARGRAELDFSAARPRLALDVATGPLALDALFAGPPPLPPEPMTRRAAAASMAAARQAPPGPGWSRTPLALPKSFPLDADVTVTAPQIAWQRYRLDQARAALQLAERQLSVRQLNGSLYGGQLSASGLFEPGTRPRFAGHAELRGADLASLLPALMDTRSIAGRGDVTADLEASGSSMADLIGSLSGTLDVGARDGLITGIDVAAVAEHLKRSAPPTDLIQVGRLVTTGQTRFATVDGHFQLERGVARTDSLTLTAARASARTRGSIDLGQWTLNLVNEFQLSDPPEVPPFAIKLDGSLAAPRRVFDLNRLQSYLLRRGAPAPGR